MKTDYSTILSSLRRERNLNQRKVAEDLGISQALLSHYENGVREPRFEFVVRACDYYGVSADYFLGRTSEKTYDDKVLLPCPCPPLHKSLNFAAVVFSALDDVGDSGLSAAAAGYFSTFMRGALLHMRQPFMPADPAVDASVMLAEAAFLSAVRVAAEKGLLPDLSPAALKEKYPALYCTLGDESENG